MLRAEKPQGDRLLPVSEQMKAGSAALADELRGWPQVTLKAVFGFTPFTAVSSCSAGYLAHAAFSQGTRLHSDSMARIKRHAPSSAKIAARLLVDQQKTRWFLFEVPCDSDLRDARKVLGRAFGSARAPNKTK